MSAIEKEVFEFIQASKEWGDRLGTWPMGMVKTMAQFIADFIDDRNYGETKGDARKGVAG